MNVKLQFQRLLWAALVLGGAAEDSITSGTLKPSASTKAAPTQHSIKVGNGNNHQFVPDTVRAQIGDIIEFEFFPPNHSVARAEAGIPCFPYERTGINKVGFFSGFNFLADVPDQARDPIEPEHNGMLMIKQPPTYRLLINDTEPIFFYCSAPKSCIDYAMVGVINPDASFSLAEQKSMAKKSPYMLSPGEPLPSNEDGTSPSIPTPSATHRKRLSSGAIAGIAVAGVVGAMLIGAFLFVLGRSSKILPRRRKDPPANLWSHPGHESGTPLPYPSKPMSDYDPYAPLSPYGIPLPQSPPAELSTPNPDLNKHSSALSGETAYDEARWQTITPPPNRQAAIHSELDASQHAQSSKFQDALGIREDRFQ